MGILQAEHKEWVIIPETGELVEVAAKTKHSKMDEDEITDYLPEGSYIFSNDKSMKLNKKDFEDVAVSTRIPKYKEGEKPEEYKEYTLADEYFTAKTNTPADLIKNVQKKHAVITDDEMKYNPFVQLANDLNKQNREPIVNFIKDVSEQIKPTDEPVVQKFKQGGYVPKYQNFGEVFGGVSSGAGAGAAIGSIFPGAGTLIGAGVGALAGGIGAYATGQNANKQGEQRLKQLELLQSRREGRLQDSYNTANATTMGKFAVQTPTYDRLDLSDTKQTINDNFENIYRNYDQRKNNIIANNLSTGNTTMRNARGLGMSPGQTQNLAANVAGNAINSSNQIGANYDNQLDNLKLQQVAQTTPLDLQEKTTNLGLTNLEKDQKYEKNVGFVNEMGANRGINISQEDQLDVDNFANTMALKDGNAAFRANSIGAFNNSLLNAGQSAGMISSMISNNGNGTGGESGRYAKGANNDMSGISAKGALDSGRFTPKFGLNYNGQGVDNSNNVTPKFNILIDNNTGNQYEVINGELVKIK